MRNIFLAVFHGLVILILVKDTVYEAPQCAVFSIVHLHPLSDIQIFLSPPYSETIYSHFSLGMMNQL